LGDPLGEVPPRCHFAFSDVLSFVLHFWAKILKLPSPLISADLGVQKTAYFWQLFVQPSPPVSADLGVQQQQIWATISAAIPLPSIYYLLIWVPETSMFWQAFW